MTKLVIIGIDSMDRDLVNKYQDSMPNFKKIIDISEKIRLESVFPPDSDTAWASIYTGLNPAKHGIVNFVDPLEKASIYQTDYLDVSTIKGKTFWDIAGKSGKRVCLVYPHVAYPVWPVNGYMISPIPKTDTFQVYPNNFKYNFNLENINAKVPRHIPNSEREYDDYLKGFRDIVMNQFNFGNNMLKNYDWDLFFFYSSALDFIQHIFWNYCDPNDPTFPGEDNRFRHAIRDFYILHDELIGNMIADLDPKTAILILSDHGHTMRPINLFNVNEVLRKHNFLFTKESKYAPILSCFEKVKRSTVNIAQSNTGLRGMSLRLLRTMPKVKELYTIPSVIDFDRTIAHCTDLSGMKSYSYGGIIINKDNVDQKDYINYKENIIKMLSSWTLPNSREHVFEWICEKEQLYSGQYIKKYPDIVFKLKKEYGAGWAVNTPIFSKTNAHNFFPGSHSGATPIFYLLNVGDKSVVKQDITLMDVAPTILNILDVDEYLDFDGISILEEGYQ